MSFAEISTLALKLNNFEDDPVTGLKVLWVDTQNYKAVVPTGKRWFLIGGVVNRNVSSTVSGSLCDSADKVIGRVLEEAAGTGVTMYPEQAYQTGNLNVLDASEYVLMYFGTAQDAGSYCSCVVLEVDV